MYTFAQYGFINYIRKFIDDEEDFDDDCMDLDVEDAPILDDSLANDSRNDTNHLVNEMVRDTGARKRRPRSPSPDGSASSCGEDSPKKKQHSKKKKSNSNNMAMAAINALEKIAGFSKSGNKRKQEESDDDSDMEIDRPKMINWPKYNIKDNGQDVLDMKLRNALTTINAKPDSYFKHFDREIKPAFETLEIDHLNFHSVNPRVTKKMFDRGAFLELKFFDPGNISVNSRPPKASFSARSGDIMGELSLDWTEPQDMWGCFDAVLNYAINCYSIRSYDYSPWVLIKALHEMRFFNMCKNLKEQKKVFTSFVNAFFRKNELQAKKKCPPIDLEAALKVARAELSSAGYGFASCTTNVDPYAGGKSGDKEEEMKALRVKVKLNKLLTNINLIFVKVAQLERENATLQRRVDALPRTGGYAAKPLAGLAGKKANTCRDW